jgi:DNA-binding NarL/FixJ family response regulator
MKHFLVVDDHAMVRQGLMNLLCNITDFPVVCDGASSADEAFKLLADHIYDLAILDISLPGMGGLELLPRLRQIAFSTPVLMLSMYPEEQFALRALRLGASGYLTKQQAADELIIAIHKILAGERYLSQSFSETLISSLLDEADQGGPRHAKLSSREFEILRRLATGQILKQIADDLGINIKTVSTYKTRLFAKMKFRNNAELVTYAIEQNIS